MCFFWNGRIHRRVPLYNVSKPKYICLLCTKHKLSNAQGGKRLFGKAKPISKSKSVVAKRCCLRSSLIKSRMVRCGSYKHPPAARPPARPPRHRHTTQIIQIESAPLPQPSPPEMPTGVREGDPAREITGRIPAGPPPSSSSSSSSTPSLDTLRWVYSRGSWSLGSTDSRVQGKGKYAHKRFKKNCGVKPAKENFMTSRKKLSHTT